MRLYLVLCVSGAMHAMQRVETKSAAGVVVAQKITRAHADKVAAQVKTLLPEDDCKSQLIELIDQDARHFGTTPYALVEHLEIMMQRRINYHEMFLNEEGFGAKYFADKPERIKEYELNKKLLACLRVIKERLVKEQAGQEA